MHPDEVVLLTALLKTSSRYLEYGSGGSTILAEMVGVSKIDSVESDSGWIEKVSNSLISRDRVHFHHAQIGKTGDWGFPVELSSSNIWSHYALDVWGRLDGAPDMILVDGRFRTACALVSLCAIGLETRVVIHDFGDGAPERKNYTILLDFCSVVICVGSLYVLQKKADANHFQMISALARIRNDAW